MEWREERPDAAGGELGELYAQLARAETGVADGPGAGAEAERELQLLRSDLARARQAASAAQREADRLRAGGAGDAARLEAELEQRGQQRAVLLLFERRQLLLQLLACIPCLVERGGLGLPRLEVL